MEVVVDTAFYGVTDPPSTLDPDGQLDGYVSYLVYAKFTNSTDVLSAIFADVNVYPEGGCHCHCKRKCNCWNPDESMTRLH